MDWFIIFYYTMVVLVGIIVGSIIVFMWKDHPWGLGDYICCTALIVLYSILLLLGWAVSTP